MSLFSSLKKELNVAGKTITREVDRLGQSVSHSVDSMSSSPVLSHFKNGNVIQLVSRKSGRTLRIASDPGTGRLVVDGKGEEGPTVYYAHWTVMNDNRNIVKLYNQNNFLIIENGATQVVPFPPQNPVHNGKETFRLHQTGQFITLESFAEPGRHVGVQESGDLRSAMATGKEIDAQWAVRLIYSPWQAPPAPTQPGAQPVRK